jgi:hypothetical protein
MSELLAVYGIVLFAALSAVFRFMPAAWRARAAAGLVATLRELGASSQLALRIESKLATAGACGSCNSCNACATHAGPESGSRPLPDSSPAQRVILIARSPEKR